MSYTERFLWRERERERDDTCIRQCAYLNKVLGVRSKHRVQYQVVQHHVLMWAVLVVVDIVLNIVVGPQVHWALALLIS